MCVESWSAVSWVPLCHPLWPTCTWKKWRRKHSPTHWFRYVDDTRVKIQALQHSLMFDSHHPVKCKLVIGYQDSEPESRNIPTSTKAKKEKYCTGIWTHPSWLVDTPKWAFNKAVYCLWLMCPRSYKEFSGSSVLCPLQSHKHIETEHPP